jgi:hypothetical protein
MVEQHAFGSEKGAGFRFVEKRELAFRTTGAWRGSEKTGLGDRNL